MIVSKEPEGAKSSKLQQMKRKKINKMYRETERDGERHRNRDRDRSRETEYRQKQTQIDRNKFRETEKEI